LVVDPTDRFARFVRDDVAYEEWRRNGVEFLLLIEGRPDVFPDDFAH
jgi:hypothetical protein